MLLLIQIESRPNRLRLSQKDPTQPREDALAGTPLEPNRGRQWERERQQHVPTGWLMPGASLCVQLVSRLPQRLHRDPVSTWKSVMHAFVPQISVLAQRGKQTMVLPSRGLYSCRNQVLRIALSVLPVCLISLHLQDWLKFYLL